MHVSGCPVSYLVVFVAEEPVPVLPEHLLLPDELFCSVVGGPVVVADVAACLDAAENIGLEAAVRVDGVREVFPHKKIGYR